MKTTPPLPSQMFSGLFEDVQMSQVFPDSKTFVDAIPNSAPDHILSVYTNEKNTPGFSLKAFVKTHFSLPSDLSDPYQTNPEHNTKEHIEHLWSILMRNDYESDASPSRLPLDHPYVVPGGRFREVYYWDSYFTMLGLVESGKIDLVSSMVQNFADQIDRYGHIPNGNRTYFLSRSQPPFFALMVELLAARRGDQILIQYLPHLAAEYEFWSRSSRNYLESLNIHLNHYSDDLNLPRGESYREDVELMEELKDLGNTSSQLYREIRAACESGWDFSVRWFNDSQNMSTIDATTIAPIDLNCLLVQLERTLSKAYHLSGNSDQAEHFENQSLERIACIQEKCWNESVGCYYDYQTRHAKQTDILSMAAFFPMFIGIANEDQATAVVNKLKVELLRPGGWRSTNLHSGQQWDAPNGWAPLQWIAFIALKNYGFNTMAEDAATRWLTLNDRVFERTGKMMEKYNVEDISLDAGGGEYPVQDGFGWTNGVYLALTAAIQ